MPTAYSPKIGEGTSFHDASKDINTRQGSFRSGPFNPDSTEAYEPQIQEGTFFNDTDNDIDTRPTEFQSTPEDPFTISPAIALDPTSGAASSTTEVTGTGFTPSSTVSVQLILDSGPTPVGDPSVYDTDELGGFVENFTIDSGATTAAHTIEATDVLTEVTADAAFTVTA